MFKLGHTNLNSWSSDSRQNILRQAGDLLISKLKKKHQNLKILGRHKKK